MRETKQQEINSLKLFSWGKNPHVSTQKVDTKILIS